MQRNLRCRPPWEGCGGSLHQHQSCRLRPACRYHKPLQARQRWKSTRMPRKKKKTDWVENHHPSVCIYQVRRKGASLWTRPVATASDDARTSCRAPRMLPSKSPCRETDRAWARMPCFASIWKTNATQLVPWPSTAKQRPCTTPESTGLSWRRTRRALSWRPVNVRTYKNMKISSWCSAV